MFTAGNLGVVFDSDFNFHQHISQVCKSCFYHICDLRRIWRHISISTAKTISTALISSHLDYCNSLLNNTAKRDLANSNKYTIVWHMWISGCLGFHHHYHYLNSYTGFLLLIELILSCPLLHIMLYLHNNHPTWLVSCIFQISLDSSDHQFHNLLCQKTKINLGKFAFSVAAPRVWNELPITLKTSVTLAIFRKNLKTYLIAFPP